VTGASQGIGAEVVRAFVERGFNVVANSQKMTQSTEIAASDRVAVMDGDIGRPATAGRIVETALSRFRSIDVLVNNAGIFFTKPFADYTAEDFRAGFDEPRRLPVRHPTGRQADAGAEDRRKRRHHHGCAGS
jgi:NAD(P)-dependent dehydrogenase (short-subunit alcohol dehydrogenase family)